ncbi:hypothetical protein NLM27_26055 [Bradyrhizobium sp. CCGB12]|uniref:hypothetical protein n=1 Tax=Bradyrhizobium sp. CCGB12 TaxID=2949632 RepID=UPI0020B1A2D8|nr:hypothetical protein [Bradyrhizobium sp. CCGB12]MCP3392237.1 hypothetical protein [Bradyrhizobium sp. CCGB12]
MALQSSAHRRHATKLTEKRRSTCFLVWRPEQQDLSALVFGRMKMGNELKLNDFSLAVR